MGAGDFMVVVNSFKFSDEQTPCHQIRSKNVHLFFPFFPNFNLFKQKILLIRAQNQRKKGLFIANHDLQLHRKRIANADPDQDST